MSAVKLKELPDQADARAKRQARKTQTDTLKGKKFAELLPAEKDELLKQIALRLGMIQDD